MQHIRHALSAVLIAAALAAGTAACGTAAKPTANPDPLARLTADQIVNRAIADLSAATSVRLTGTGTDSGHVIGLALTLVHGQGCEGSFSLQGEGSLRIVYNGKSAWYQPSDSFYKSQGASTAAISLLSGKWLKTGKTSDLSGFSTYCSLSGWVGGMNENSAGRTKGAVTTVGGQRAVTIHTTGGTLYISDAAKPEILKANIGLKGSTGSITFSDYGVRVTITLPPADQTLDGSQFGF